MSQQYPPVEPSPDPFERFPLYTPPADPPVEPVQQPAAASSQALVPVPPRPVVQASGHPYSTGLVATDAQLPSQTVTIVAWVVAVVTGLYMLPWAIAATRGKANQWAIFAGNLLLGWTLVGWIVALVKACGAHRALYPVGAYPALTASAQPLANPGWYPSPDGRGVRYWDGTRWTAHQPG